MTRIHVPIYWVAIWGGPQILSPGSPGRGLERMHGRVKESDTMATKKKAAKKKVAKKKVAKKKAAKK